MILNADRRVADSLPRTWVDYAPESMRPFLRLARYDRPIGFWLLATPCWLGVLLAGAGEGLGWTDLQLALLFTAGAVAMRGAGCTWNDIIDRDLDARVARTADRPLAAGTVSVRAAVLFLLAQCLAGFMVLVSLPPLAAGIALGALVLVAAYPFMKRITWWPQAWLGLTFNWGALVGYAAAAGEIGAAAILLYAACVLWTLGYDTIYARQDMEDDATVGVRSAARLFGGRYENWLWGFYLGAAVLAGAAAVVKQATPWFVIPFALFAYHLFNQIRRIRGAGPETCLAAFRSNREAGLLLAAAFAVAALVI
ncbi:MAG: 4-hydroxybenzoate octaprenyltransferase [Maricaulaceae bacterium]|nr:4-hydroxybenzoate octaprenyltransferase [Maricaulaceae bacterium]